MATFSESSLNDGDSLGVDPLVDVFNIDDAGIPAADSFFDSLDGTTSVTSFGGKTVTTTSVTFANGSLPQGCLNERDHH